MMMLLKTGDLTLGTSGPFFLSFSLLFFFFFFFVPEGSRSVVQHSLRLSSGSSPATHCSTLSTIKPYPSSTIVTKGFVWRKIQFAALSIKHNNRQGCGFEEKKILFHFSEFWDEVMNLCELVNGFQLFDNSAIHCSKFTWSCDGVNKDIIFWCTDRQSKSYLIRKELDSWLVELRIWKELVISGLSTSGY